MTKHFPLTNQEIFTMSKSKAVKKVVTTTQVKVNQECKNKRQVLSQLKRIKWDIEFQTENQEIFYNTIDKNDISFCAGPAGCGKTYIAVYYALQQLATSKKYDGIIITKPLVEVEGEKLGYLPGNVEEKTEPFMMSIYYNMEQIIGRDRLKMLRDTGVITVVPLAYMRGLTLTNRMVLLDEAQNSTPLQIKTFLTRIGKGSKFIISGDLQQSDVKHKNGNGLEDAIRRLTGLPHLGFSQFTLADIVRHPVVAGILERYNKEYDIADLPAEATLSAWLEHPKYDYSRITNRWG